MWLRLIPAYLTVDIFGPNLWAHCFGGSAAERRDWTSAAELLSQRFSTVSVVMTMICWTEIASECKRLLFCFRLNKRKTGQCQECFELKSWNLRKEKYVPRSPHDSKLTSDRKNIGSVQIWAIYPHAKLFLTSSYSAPSIFLMPEDKPDMSWSSENTSPEIGPNRTNIVADQIKVRGTSLFFFHPDFIHGFNLQKGNNCSGSITFFFQSSWKTAKSLSERCYPSASIMQAVLSTREGKGRNCLVQELVLQHLLVQNTGEIFLLFLIKDSHSDLICCKLL